MKMPAEDVQSSQRYILLRIDGYIGCEWYLMDLEELNKRSSSGGGGGAVVKEEGILYPFLCFPYSNPQGCCASTGKYFYFCGGCRQPMTDSYLPSHYRELCFIEDNQRKRWKSDTALVAATESNENAANGKSTEPRGCTMEANNHLHPNPNQPEQGSVEDHPMLDHGSASNVNEDPTESEADEPETESNRDIVEVQSISNIMKTGLNPDILEAEPKLHTVDFPSRQMRNLTSFKFDASKPEEGFVETSSSRHPTSYARALAFKGKIYVFGRLDIREEDCGECFDPEPDTWTIISSPMEKSLYPESDTSTTVSSSPLLPCSFTPVAIPYNEIQLLMGPFNLKDDQHVYALYNVESKIWTPFPNQSSDLHSCTGCIPVKVDTVLFYRVGGDSYHFGEIWALDLESGQRYEGGIPTPLVDNTYLITREDSFVMTNLFHLGGNNFCFFTTLASSGGYESTYSILFTKVQVVMAYCHGAYLDVTCVSTLSNPLPINKMTEIIDATPVDEIFVKALQDIEKPDMEKADGSCVLASNVVTWVSRIAVVGILTLMVGTITISLVRTGTK